MQQQKNHMRGVLALLLVLGLVAAACGGGEAEETTTTATAESATETTDPTDGDMTDDMSDLGVIDYLGWEGYDTFFGANADEVAHLGIEFKSTYMGAPSDIAARFASGGGEGTDLLAWTSSNHAQFRAIEGVLSPISPDEVPNLDGLISQFADDTWNQFKDADGNWLAIPFSFAPIGITYDSTQVSPTSYADLLDPSLTGKVGIPDIPGLHVQTASAALGYQAGTLDEAQLGEVINFMQGMWNQARVVSPSFGDIIGLLNSGEIAAAYGGYPGLGTFTENPNILTAFPEEGTFSFVEVFSIPAGADNRAAALAFINAMLDPATNAAINDALAQATTVQASIDMMSDDNKALYPYAELDDFFAKNSVMTLPTGEDGAVGMGAFIDAYATLTTGG